MRIAMIGSGYVGLVSGVCFADFGHDVVCIDKDAAKIVQLEAGHMPIYEPGLKEIVDKNVREGRLAFATDLAKGVEGAKAIFIAVGTPSRRGDGYADLSYVYAAAKEIAAHAADDAVIVTKSTVPVGTGDEVERIVREIRPDSHIQVVSNPEFLREGAAISDFKHPDRIVIGADDPRAREVMQEAYRPLYLNNQPILFMARRTAELTKYAANAFLATKITFINEIADLCEATGANVQDVARGIGLDNRIGRKFLHAGPGYGGSCFPKDVKALVRTGHEYGIELRVLTAVEAANETQKRVLVDKVVARFGEDLHGRTFALWGLAFKPDTDDMRDAPSRVIIHELLKRGAAIRAYDPVAMDEARRIFGDLPGLTLVNHQVEALQDADALLIATEWREFKSPDFEQIRARLKQALIFDGRNLFDPPQVRELAIEYYGIGRGQTVTPPNEGQ